MTNAVLFIGAFLIVALLVVQMILKDARRRTE